MPKTPARSSTPEQILRDHSPDVREIAERLRTLIGATLPEATECAYPGWHGIGYRHPSAGYIGAIFPLQDRVRLGFEHGARLPDPAGMLTGDGKQLRYVEVLPGADINERAIRALLVDAVALRAHSSNR
jgi:hypothetical protein